MGFIYLIIHGNPLLAYVSPRPSLPALLNRRLKPPLTTMRLDRTIHCTFTAPTSRC